MKVDRYRVVAWLVSGFCLAVSAGLLANRHQAFVEAAHRNAQAAADLQKAREDSLAVLQRPHDAHVACAPRTPLEETQFLIDLRSRAHRCGVSIARWSSRSSSYKKDAGAAPDPSDRILENVTKVSCDLQLDGPYPALRAFLRDLASTQRLFTVSGVNWNRGETSSELAMTIGRYVVSDAPASSTAPAAGSSPS